MHTVIFTIALAVVVTGVYINLTSEKPLDYQNLKVQIKDEENSVLSEFSEKENLFDDLKLKPTVSLSPTQDKAKITNVTPIPALNLNSSQESLVYPNANFLRKKGDSNVYVSSDHPDLILKWYKNFFKEKNVKVTSQVVTKANENYLYKFSTFLGSENIQITIQRDADDKDSEIEILSTN